METPNDQPEAHRDLPLIVLASSSPRRREMLASSGIEHRVCPATIDDGDLIPGNLTTPHQWVAALAYLKALSSARTIDITENHAPMAIIGADTVCLQDSQIIGQPKDRAHAKNIINQMANSTHQVLTGVAILNPHTNQRDLFVDSSTVTVGQISDAQIETYLDSQLWCGKAGAYNITERLAAGWPITFTGDESSIVGLPLTRVLQRIKSFYQSTKKQ